MPNPISRLPLHDNGIVVDLPPPPNGGSEEVSGTLTIGVGTAENNRLGTSGILSLNAGGRFTTVVDGKAFPASTIDSGTETYVFDDDGVPRCPDMAWAYCVKPTRQLIADLSGLDGTRLWVRFAVGDYRVRRDQHAGASDDVAVSAEPRSGTFVWGAPFFLGRRVSLVIDGRPVPGHPGIAGPLYAVAQEVSTSGRKTP